jgi:hypothetical protein
MKLTFEELAQKGMTQAHLKGWHDFIVETLKTNTVAFPLKGPVTLNVRTRRPAGTSALSGRARPATTSSTYPFLGGEELRITSLIVTALAHEHAIRLSVSLVPTALKMQTEFSGLSLPVDDAGNHLEGFEDWLISTQQGFVDAQVLEQEARKKAELEKGRPAIISQEEFEQSEEYGSW